MCPLALPLRSWLREAHLGSAPAELVKRERPTASHVITGLTCECELGTERVLNPARVKHRWFTAAPSPGVSAPTQPQATGDKAYPLNNSF